MQDIHDIRPPVPVGIDPFIIKAVVAGAAGLLALALIVFLVRKLWKKRKQETLLPGLPAPVPPLDDALRALDRLESVSVTDTRRFYFELTAVLKKYIGRSFDTRAAEMTSQEFVRSIRGLNFRGALYQDILEFMDRSDPIKYAGTAADTEQARTDLGCVRKIIQDVEQQFKIEAEKEEEI